MAEELGADPVVAVDLEAELRARLTISLQRAYHPQGVQRQMLAILADTTRPGSDDAGPRLPAYEFNPPEAVHPHLSPPRAIGSLTHFGNLPFAHDA